MAGKHRWVQAGLQWQPAGAGLQQGLAVWSAWGPCALGAWLLLLMPLLLLLLLMLLLLVQLLACLTLTVGMVLLRRPGAVVLQGLGGEA